MPFNSAFDRAFGVPRQPTVRQDKSGDGPYSTAPYGDTREFVEYVPPPATPITYPRFHPTDARAVEIYLEPLHYNLIPNPSLRVNDDGWSVSPGLTLNQDSWVGQSMEFTSDGTVQHEKIYVGPTDPLAGAMDWYEPGMGGPEYTFDLFAKGAGAYLRLSLYGYKPKDPQAWPPEPEDTPSAEVHSPMALVNNPDWERFDVRTTSRMADISGGIPDFAQCWWIVPHVEISEEGGLFAPTVLLSSFLLDPTEGPLCDYFDGDMNEGGARDDYIWLKDRQGKKRFSAYYPQRVERCTYLHQHVYEAVPVNRPIHIYYHDRANPWDPGGPPPHELTGQLRTDSVDGPSMVEVAVNRYEVLSAPIP